MKDAKLMAVDDSQTNDALYPVEVVITCAT